MDLYYEHLRVTDINIVQFKLLQPNYLSPVHVVLGDCPWLVCHWVKLQQSESYQVLEPLLLSRAQS